MSPVPQARSKHSGLSPGGSEAIRSRFQCESRQKERARVMKSYLRAISVKTCSL